MLFRTAAVLLALATTTVGCGQRAAAPAPAATPTTSSTAPSGPEALLASLPAGNHLLFGGNYMRLQQFMQSSLLGKLVGTMEGTSPGLTAWTNCWSTLLQGSMLAGVQVGAGRLEMRFAIAGVGISTVESCARKAGYPVAVDPDRKFVAVEQKTAAGTTKTGYLALPSGVLYYRQTTELANPTALTNVDRASLEADVATLARATAASDTALTAQLPDVDRSKPMWFVGTGAGTSLAAKLGAFAGTIEVSPGMALDVTAQIHDAAIGDEIARVIPVLQAQAAQFGPVIEGAIRDMRFSRDGDRFRLAIAFTDAQLEALTAQLGGALAGGGNAIAAPPTP